MNDVQPNKVILIETKSQNYVMYSAFAKPSGISNSGEIIILVSNTVISAIVETTETENPNKYALKL